MTEENQQNLLLSYLNIKTMLLAVHKYDVPVIILKQYNQCFHSIG